MHIAVDPYLLRTENGDCWRTETALSAYELLSDDSARQIVLGHEMRVSGEVTSLVRENQQPNPKMDPQQQKGSPQQPGPPLSPWREVITWIIILVFFAAWYSVVLWPKAHHVSTFPTVLS
jgi:hypothetical protein